MPQTNQAITAIPIRPLTEITRRDINRAILESRWFAALAGHPEVPAEAKELIRCLIIAHCNKISEYLSNRTNPPPDQVMVEDIYQWGRWLYPDQNGKDSVTLVLLRMEELGITGVPPQLSRYALSKVQRHRNAGGTQ
jgi:hypothetical protein